MGRENIAREKYEATVADEPTEQETTPADEPHATTNTSGEDERYRGATPPGYDWPTHGGYLGCLLGVMTACLLAPLGYIVFGFVGALFSPSLGGFGIALAALATIAVYLAVFVALTRLGWALGKRFLREYEQPSRPVWGEDDEDYPLVVEADPGSGARADTEPDAAPKQPQSETENAG